MISTQQRQISVFSPQPLRASVGSSVAFKLSALVCLPKSSELTDWNLISETTLHSLPQQFHFKQQNA
jgi:hypothetical protein